jgi:hypothetical protein
MAMPPKTVMRKRVKQPDEDAADAEVAHFAALAAAGQNPPVWVPPLMAPPDWRLIAPVVAGPDDVDPPALDEQDLQVWDSAPVFLSLNPLERNGARRRAPLSERFVAFAGSRIDQMIERTESVRGEGESGVTASAQLRNGQRCAMRVSKNYTARSAANYRREVAKHVLLERLREQYPQLMRNVVQLVDYQLVTDMPIGTLYTHSVPPLLVPANSDANATVPRLVSLFESCTWTLDEFVRDMVAPAPAAGQLTFFTALLIQLLCQLAYLHRLLPRFNHNDLHLKNLMMQRVEDTGVGTADDLVYDLQLDQGTIVDGRETAPRVSIRLPVKPTGNALLKIIDLDLAYLEYLPADGAGSAATEALPPSHATDESLKRQYNVDLIRVVTVLILEFERAVNLRGVLAQSQFVLAELQAFLGRLYSTHRAVHREKREFAIAQILARDPMFSRTVERGVYEPHGAPVVGTRQVDNGHVRVERIRSELAALAK